MMSEKGTITIQQLIDKLMEQPDKTKKVIGTFYLCPMSTLHGDEFYQFDVESIEVDDGHVLLDGCIDLSEQD